MQDINLERQSKLIPSHGGVPILENELETYYIAPADIDRLEVEQPLMPDPSEDIPIEDTPAENPRPGTDKDRLLALITEMKQGKPNYVDVRYFLNMLHRIRGYPTRPGYHNDYYGGVALWVQDDWSVYQTSTKIHWDQHPEDKFRKFFVEYNGLEVVSDLPVVGGIYSDLMQMFVKDQHPFYPNIIYYGTLHDDIIDANIDYILIDLKKLLMEKFPDITGPYGFMTAEWDQ